MTKFRRVTSRRSLGPQAGVASLDVDGREFLIFVRDPTGGQPGCPKEAANMTMRKHNNEHPHRSTPKHSRPHSREPRDAVDEMEGPEAAERNPLFAASAAATEYANEVEDSDLPTGDWSE